MKGDGLPPKDHIARYCGGSHISEDGQIAPTAFSLRHNEVYLSVRWLEFFEQPNRSSEIEEVRRVLKADLKIGATAKIAVLNVGDVRNYVEEVSGYLIRILHEPLPSDNSHSGIFDTGQDEELITELLTEKIVETHPGLELN